MYQLSGCGYIGEREPAGGYGAGLAANGAHFYNELHSFARSEIDGSFYGYGFAAAGRVQEIDRIG